MNIFHVKMEHHIIDLVLLNNKKFYISKISYGPCGLRCVSRFRENMVLVKGNI